jgi:putative phosphoesterase
MRIAIISDTHLSRGITKLKALLNRLGPVDLLIHAGDYTTVDVIDVLQNTVNFCGVWGNADNGAVNGRLNEKEILLLSNYRIGIFHGHGKESTTLDRAYAAFEHDNVAIIIFGHSHQPLICTRRKVLMLNPGSPLNKRTQRWFSYIILDLLPGSIEARLVFFDNL